MILAICINSDYNKNYLAIIVKILTSSLAQLKRFFFFLNNYSQFQKSFPGVAFFLTLVLESIKCYRKLKIILFSNKPLFLFCKKFAIVAAILLNCEFINSMWALFFQGIVFFSNFKTVCFFRVWIGIQTHVIFILNIQINHVTYYFLHVKESLDHTTRDSVVVYCLIVGLQLIIE